MQEAALAEAGNVLGQPELVECAQASSEALLLPAVDSGFDFEWVLPFDMSCTVAGLAAVARAISSWLASCRMRSILGPFLDGNQIHCVGSVGPTQRVALLGGALGLLRLIQFDKPFGLSVVEAMAAGTPAVAFRGGSIPDLIENGVSGVSG